MELNNLFGLPAHPLLVHLPVVMVPLAAIGALVLAIRPRFWSREVVRNWNTKWSARRCLSTTHSWVKPPV